MKEALTSGNAGQGLLLLIPGPGQPSVYPADWSYCTLSCSDLARSRWPTENHTLTVRPGWCLPTSTCASPSIPDKTVRRSFAVAPPFFVLIDLRKRSKVETWASRIRKAPRPGTMNLLTGVSHCSSAASATVAPSDFYARSRPEPARYDACRSQRGRWCCLQAPDRRCRMCTSRTARFRRTGRRWSVRPSAAA